MFIASFADGELLVGVAGLISAGNEPEVSADVTWIFEAAWIFNGEDEGQRGDGTNSANLLGLWCQAKRD